MNLRIIEITGKQKNISNTLIISCSRARKEIDSSFDNFIDSDLTIIVAIDSIEIIFAEDTSKVLLLKAAQPSAETSA